MEKFNIDIHFDYAMAVKVEAKDIDEAVRIVEDKIAKGEIKPTQAEPTDDYDLDTSYQEED